MVVIGQLARVKGVDVLIKATTLIKEAIPDFRLYIIGSGPMENNFKTLVRRMHLEETVDFWEEFQT